MSETEPTGAYPGGPRSTDNDGPTERDYIEHQLNALFDSFSWDGDSRLAFHLTEAAAAIGETIPMGRWSGIAELLIAQAFGFYSRKPAGAAGSEAPSHPTNPTNPAETPPTTR